jgi:predicted phosphodiesterase
MADYPQEQVLEIGGKRLLLTHQVKLVKGDCFLLEAFRGRDLDAVVFGHSHMVLEEWREGVLLFKPGAAGKRRFRVVPSVGILEVGSDTLRSRVILL